MTMSQVLDLPTVQLEELTEAQLIEKLGDLIPQSRVPDKDNAQTRDVKQMIALAQKLVGQK